MLYRILISIILINFTFANEVNPPVEYGNQESKLNKMALIYLDKLAIETRKNEFGQVTNEALISSADQISNTTFKLLNMLNELREGKEIPSQKMQGEGQEGLPKKIYNFKKGEGKVAEGAKSPTPAKNPSEAPSDPDKKYCGMYNASVGSPADEVSPFLKSLDFSTEESSKKSFALLAKKAVERFWTTGMIAVALHMPEANFYYRILDQGNLWDKVLNQCPLSDDIRGKSISLLISQKYYWPGITVQALTSPSDVSGPNYKDFFNLYYRLYGEEPPPIPNP